jgi:cyclophilin family peptidyl-prolyl cis-trans isomerase
VVPDFIIQGGNSDRYETSKKRNEIGKYLLPPDTNKGYKHHRGVISMPSSEIENPHKLASPYEFFIVQQNPGAYHLDGSYTAFGKVISGMEVVDKINKQRTDKRETPLTNVFMDISILE